MWEYDDGFQRVRLWFGTSPVDFRRVLWVRLILAVFVCAVSHRIFSQNLKYISARMPRIQENGGLPSGFYLYIGITSCAYKISQFFLVFNMECYLK